MTRPRCQQENPIHARFCLGCGAHITLAGSSCGAELPARLDAESGEAHYREALALAEPRGMRPVSGRRGGKVS